MTTPFLSRAEIVELDQLYLEAFAAVEHLRHRTPVGRALHAVKLPPKLSEGIVALHCREVFGPSAHVVGRCKPHDLTLRTNRVLNVAVKGSGVGDWAVITAADRLANALVWVDYAQRLADARAPVSLWRVPVGRLPQAAPRTLLRSHCVGLSPIEILPGR